MTEGLVWSSLLLVFLGLGWLGWREYQKVEAYRSWAQQFERSKYDIYAVLGQAGETLTWGRPTSKGPVELTSCTFSEISTVYLRVDQHLITSPPFPEQGKEVWIELQLREQEQVVKILFTELPIAVEWVEYLQRAISA